MTARITGAARAALAAQITADYASGHSIRAVAALHGRSYTFVHGILRATDGLHIRPVSNGTPPGEAGVGVPVVAVGRPGQRPAGRHPGQAGQHGDALDVGERRGDPGDACWRITRARARWRAAAEGWCAERGHSFTRTALGWRRPDPREAKAGRVTVPGE